MKEVLVSTRRRLRIFGAITTSLVLAWCQASVMAQEDPPGCDSTGVGITIQARVGGLPTTGPVAEGDSIVYRVTVSHPGGTACNFEGGQLSLTLPDNTLVQLAGFGGATPNVPLITDISPFVVDSPVAYIADPADRVLSGAQLVLIARTDYGSTGFRPGQTNGTFFTDPPQQTASASTSIPLGILFCGDGIVNLDEFCDDGNTNNDDACRNDCTACGDGVLQTGAGEVCDDGNNDDHDGCDSECQPEDCEVRVDKQVSCDGVNWFDAGLVESNEDGTFGPVPGCNVNDPVYVRYQVSNVGDVDVQNCTLSESSSVINPGGTVQSGFLIGFGVTLPPLDADSNQDCTAALEDQEPNTATLMCECVQPSLPPGNAQASDSATVECVPICGDGIVGNTPGETCDPPGSVQPNGNVCSADCQFCGDNQVNEPNEVCDGTDDSACPGECTDQCICETCGDGIVGNTPGETCDPPGSVQPNGNVCSADCQFCGDNAVNEPGEECDGTDDSACPGNCEDDCTCLRPCAVTIEKTVAPDAECDGFADGEFVESVEMDKTECVVYRICVSNPGAPGDQSLNSAGVQVSDPKLGIVDLNFGTLAPGDTVCKFIPSEEATACIGPDGTCFCQDVEGVNTATVTSAVCEESQDDACDTSLHPNSDCNDNARVNCTGGCRITAGRTNRLGHNSEPLEVSLGQSARGQGGGQVGAPCGCSGCFTTGEDPEADLAYEHIQGNWQYARHDGEERDPFKVGTFHAKEFNSLVCGCDTDPVTATNCSELPPFDPDDFKDGKLCGNRLVGPEPRPAPANEICFSGKADWTPTNGPKAYKVAFRVEAEDRGEPSRGKNADGTCDVHWIRVWIPRCDNDATVACASDDDCPGSFCESVDELAHASCCRVANGDDGMPVSGIRLPDIDDGGVLINGNIQIHPQTSNTNRGRCPVPDGSCQE